MLCSDDSYICVAICVLVPFIAQKACWMLQCYMKNNKGEHPQWQKSLCSWEKCKISGIIVVKYSFKTPQLDSVEPLGQIWSFKF